MTEKRELKIDVGIIAEKRKARSKWTEDIWCPTAIIEGQIPQNPGEIIQKTELVESYFMGVAEIYCHAKETESYIHNFESEVPCVFVVLRRDEEDEHPLPWYVHVVTVSPYEAQDYADSAEDIIERVTMPLSIAKTIMDFIDQHHQEIVFKKRKRHNYKNEPHQFGKDPIFQAYNGPLNKGTGNG